RHHGGAHVIRLAGLDVIVPRLDHPQRAMLQEERRGVARHGKIVGFASRLHRAEKSINIAHVPSPSLSGMKIRLQTCAVPAAIAASMSIQASSQIWPSGSAKLRPYMKP